MATFRLLLLLLPIAGCTSNHKEPCSQAYDHLVQIAKQEGHESTRERFVRTCEEAWDEGRLKCIMEATAPEEALKCRAGRVPPG